MKTLKITLKKEEYEKLVQALEAREKREPGGNTDPTTWANYTVFKAINALAAKERGEG